jgi:hypothetical protein
MMFYFQTECRIGNRGRRICRRYTGLEAFVAILLEFTLRLAIDVVLLLVVFGVRFATWILKTAMQLARQSWRTAVAVMTVIVYVLTLPFVLLNRAADRHRPRNGPDSTPHAAAFTGKPDWSRFADSL